MEAHHFVEDFRVYPLFLYIRSELSFRSSHAEGYVVSTADILSVVKPSSGSIASLSNDDELVVTGESGNSKSTATGAGGRRDETAIAADERLALRGELSSANLKHIGESFLHLSAKEESLARVGKYGIYICVRV